MVGVLAGRDNSVGASVSEGIVTFAGVVGTLCRDADNVLLLRYLTVNIEQHRCVADMITCDLRGADLQRFFGYAEVELAPASPLGVAMLASVPFAFALHLDTSLLSIRRCSCPFNVRKGMLRAKVF